MSRTDVHTPGWVKDRDPSWRRWFAERHDHHDGICDLHIWLTTPHADFSIRCHLAYTGRRNIYCGCTLCTGAHDRRRHHRQHRAAWKATERTLRGLARAGSPTDAPIQATGNPHRPGSWIYRPLQGIKRPDGGQA